MAVITNQSYRGELDRKGIRVANDLTKRQASMVAAARKEGNVAYFKRGKLVVAPKRIQKEVEVEGSQHPKQTEGGRRRDPSSPPKGNNRPGQVLGKETAAVGNDWPPLQSRDGSDAVVGTLNTRTRGATRNSNPTLRLNDTAIGADDWGNHRERRSLSAQGDAGGYASDDDWAPPTHHDKSGDVMGLQLDATAGSGWADGSSSSIINMAQSFTPRTPPASAGRGRGRNKLSSGGGASAPDHGHTSPPGLSREVLFSGRLSGSSSGGTYVPRGFGRGTPDEGEGSAATHPSSSSRGKEGHREDHRPRTRSQMRAINTYFINDVTGGQRRRATDSQ